MTNTVTNTTENVPSNFVELIDKHSPEIGGKIESVFIELANQAGVAVEYFWPLFVKQQVIEGFSALFLCGLWVVAVWLFVKLMASNKMLVDEHDCDLPTKWFFVFITLGLIVVIGFVFIIKHTFDITTNLFNPEYAAIKDVIDLVK